jgi:murein DD-endopeptidase MepM/ murein hydrolase activator NlpD
MPMKAIDYLLAAILMGTLGCARGEHLAGPAGPQPRRTPRSAYETTKRSDAAVAAWDAAGSAALRTRVVVQPTFTETLAFPPSSALAAAYTIQLRRGDRIDVDIDTDEGEPPFADIFEVIDTAIYRHVFAPERTAKHFSYTATTDGEHVLRVQPPKSQAGRYTVHVGGTPPAALAFPVEGETVAAIRGQWGDARDGGARDHKGVDIFAPRGTPVKAVAAGRIITVETTPTGGQVVWERDDMRGLLYFYAHLDEQLATVGQHVAAGDVIGRVGNTGNASGGSTHLHFGVFLPDYSAQNPTPYLTASSTSVASTGAHMPVPSELGKRIRLSGDHVRLRASPGEGGVVLSQLDAGTDMLVIGVLNGWTRVVLNDGTTGFVAGWLVSTELAGPAADRRE